jgi:KUP system potassium uptake protein
MISGAFSVTRQCMQLGFIPRLTDAPHLEDRGRADLHSRGELGPAGRVPHHRARVPEYLDDLGAAYGIAVTGTFLITTILFYVVAVALPAGRRWQAIGLVLPRLLVVDVSFFAASAC